MSDGSNPFSPSFGVTPRVLAGRDAALAAFEDSFGGGAGAPARTVLVVGSRGLGKTVMLNEFEDAALRAGWLAVSESSSPGLLQRLTRDHLPRLLREHARPRARLTSLSATLGPVGVGAAWEPGPPPESTLRAQINELTDRLADQGGGLALTAVGQTPFSFNASRYTQEELAARHRNTDLRPSGSTVLCLDAAMAGIGSNSCGPALRSRYRVDGHELGMELHLLLTTPDHIETHDEVTS